ncbi:MAG: hypothetical protein CR988_07530 [Treponema sp.]|nr:MAG: hypothetical protein CR988_07530 [Treponema sp.]
MISMGTLAYLSFAFIIFDIAVVIYLLVYRSKDYLNKSAGSLLLGSTLALLTALIVVTLDFFMDMPVLIPAGLLLGTVLIFAFTLISKKQHKVERKTAEDKEIKTEKETEARLEKPKAEVRKMKQLLPLGQLLLHNSVLAIQKDEDSVRVVSEVVAETVQKELNADGAVMLSLDAFDDVLKVTGYTGYFPPPYTLPEDVPMKKERIITNFKYAEFPLKGNIFGNALSTGKTWIINEPETNSSVVTNSEDELLQHGPMVFAPIIFDEKLTGIIGVARAKGKEKYTGFDIEILDILCSYAGTVLNLAETLKETREAVNINNTKNITEQIQKMLLPKKLKKMGNLDIGVYFTQTRGVCSDYYDAIQNQKDRIFLTVADIASKSVESCIIMSMIRALLYLITNTRQTTDAIIDWLNKGITGKIGIDHFADITFLSYYPEKGYAEFITAGNHSMLILRKKTKKVDIYENKTDPLGVDSSSVYKSTKIEINKGDIVAMYTDGIIEALNTDGKQYGLKNLARVLVKNIDKEPKDIAKAVKDNINSFMGKNPAHDDQTILILKPVNR